jgi:phosphoglycolate phosphatase
MSLRYQLLIFDWDGTLMDSVGRIVSCMQQSARDCQLPVPETDAVRDIIGLSLRIAIPRLFAGLSDGLVEQMLARYREHYLYLDATPTPLFPGVESQLMAWHANGYQLAVATGKARAGLDRVLAETGLAPLFVASRGADEARSKPDPLMLEQILQQLDIPVCQALMVGDSIHDMAMAQALGMDRIGITWGVHGPQQLQAHGPVTIVDNLDQLAGYLSSTQVMAVTAEAE